LLVLREQERLRLTIDRVRGNDHAAHVAARRDLVHHVEEHVLDRRAKSARTGLTLRGAARRREQRVGWDDQLDFIQRQELLVLLDDRVLRLGEDAEQILLGERLKRNYDGQASDELRNEPVLQQVIW